MTTTTTDSRVWLDNLTNDDFEIIRDLYQSVTAENSVGDFTCSRKDEKLFIRSTEHKVTLMLVNAKSKNAFIADLDLMYGGEFGSIDGQDYFDNAMDKDD
jgi:hypothetical protein